MTIINLCQIVLIFTITVISAVVAAITLPFSKTLSFFVAKNIWAKSICLISRCKITVTGLKNLPDFHQPVIFCANHLSNFDIIALYIAINRPIYFIAKKELSKVPFLGWYMNLAGMIFIDRSNSEKAMQSMRNAGNLIKKGRNIVTFPEGTRSKDGEMKKFKKGSFIISKESKIPIIPTAIKNSNHVNPNNSFILKEGTIQIVFGKIITNINHFDSPEELSIYTQNKVKELVNNI
jgi:1-acyl-sn-glycerol-3-phosphate acyltransferase